MKPYKPNTVGLDYDGVMKLGKHQIMRPRKNLPLKLSFLLPFVGMGTISSAVINADTYTTGCETYQEREYDYADGETFLYFDEKPLKEIIGKPNYRLPAGRDVRLNDLIEGNKYKLEIREKVLGIIPERLSDFEKCGKNSE